MECDICGCDCDDSDVIVTGTITGILCDHCYDEMCEHGEDDDE